ncbi:MAG: hypothetical protein M3Z92_07520 [Bacteroidota bacterium]|nr:hypothetical protein [Bacteroidota bacterium]MDQ6890772.1 hypothetical protein [Bacteroidota bacterium]
MKKLSASLAFLFSICIFTFLTCTFLPAHAQQQQYANAYTYWDFGQGSDDVQNVEQKIWIAMPAISTQWVMTWAWAADPAHGGYLGFNTDDSGKGQALFSLWNATEATGGACKEFGGEGVGWSCRTPFEVRSDVSYLLRLARTRTDADGVWWGAWIVENPGSDEAKETSLGQIKVKSAMSLIRGNSINNFSEYYGQTLEKCGTVPVSILGVAPPAINKDENGNYSRTAKLNGSSNPQQNPCKTGNEAQGSLFKVENYNLGANGGALIFLGGTGNDHTLPDNIQKPAGME